MGAWYCKRCGKPMRRSRWGQWFEHIRTTVCDGQWAEWAEWD